MELVEDLSSRAFIDAFLRMTSIYGRCARLFSDNATNFVGAQRLFAEMIGSWQHEDFLQRLTTLQTEWVFITPSAPHQGGLWEAAVRRMKFHLKRVIGAQLLTSDAYRTILAQIGAILNSRPLCAVSDDIDDLDALTPGHILIGESYLILLGLTRAVA